MYDVPANKICAANGIGANEPIHIGQKLIIPNARMMRHVIPLYSETRWKHIIIHHTASDLGTAMVINRVHEDRGFWQGIGYHFLIDNGTLGKGDGQIEVSPRWIKQLVGAHCKAGNMNETGIGIALVGNFNDELPTRSQMESLTYLLRMLSGHYRISSINVMGHRDVPGAATDCPGKRFPWYQVRQCLAGR
jgi:N-acetyl-anhydromuramyl-L-alanine amidase AmpD